MNELLEAIAKLPRHTAVSIYWDVEMADIPTEREYIRADELAELLERHE